MDLNKFFLFISYKQIEEFQNSWSRASDDFEKRQALYIGILMNTDITYIAKLLCHWLGQFWLDTYVILWLVMFSDKFLLFRQHCLKWATGSGGCLKNAYKLPNLKTLKFSPLNKHIFQCMGKIFCVEFQRVPLKFHTKYLTHTLKDIIFIQYGNFKSSQI